METQKLFLFINHHIFLTDQEISKLLDRESVKVTGVSVPVWMDHNSGQTTEPADEVFVSYELQNVQEGKAKIKSQRDDLGVIGFLINLPQLPVDWTPLKEINLEEIKDLTEEERKEVFAVRDDWFAENPTPTNGNMLKKVEDGGAGRIKFEIRTSGKIASPIDDEKIKVAVYHHVDIKNVESLTKSMLL